MKLFIIDAYAPCLKRRNDFVRSINSRCFAEFTYPFPFQEEVKITVFVIRQKRDNIRAFISCVYY